MFKRLKWFKHGSQRDASAPEVKHIIFITLEEAKEYVDNGREIDFLYKSSPFSITWTSCGLALTDDYTKEYQIYVDMENLIKCGNLAGLPIQEAWTPETIEIIWIF